MGPVCQIPSCGSLSCRLIVIEAGVWSSQRPIVSHKRLSSLAYNAGSSLESLRRLASGSHHDLWAGSCGLAATIRAGSSKQKKKMKEKKKSSTLDKQWKFDELMLVWDDVFTKVCEDRSIATALHELSKSGHAQYGRGCVLVEDSVITRPWGAASGFTYKSRYASSEAPELPSYSSTGWSAKFVPKEFILDPSKAPSSMDTSYTAVQEEAVPVPHREVLQSVLRGMDRTRLLGLLEDPESVDSTDAGARDAGGEKPCDFTQDELVIMLVVLVDGQPAVGADVLKAFPTLEDNGTGSAGSLWTLKLRDGLPA